MKTRIAVTAFVLLMGCQHYFQDDSRIKAFLPGTYVRISEGEFSRAIDTLLIQKYGLEGNGYRILRKISFQRIKDGKLQAKEYQTEQWFGLYDEQDLVLHEMKQGRTLTYVPDQSKLYLGNAEYEKLQ
jgi:hypothetical protein